MGRATDDPLPYLCTSCVLLSFTVEVPVGHRSVRGFVCVGTWGLHPSCVNLTGRGGPAEGGGGALDRLGAEEVARVDSEERDVVQIVCAEWRWAWNVSRSTLLFGGILEGCSGPVSWVSGVRREDEAELCL